LKDIKQHIINNEQKNKRSTPFFFTNVFLFFNHVVVVALLLSYLASYISPEKFWILAFFGLTYPFWVFVNFLFVLFWLFVIPKRALYSLIVLLSGWSQLGAFVQPGSNNSNEKIKAPIKVMSYNVKLFDLYNWNRNTETRKHFFELIIKESPDIMCLQEFYTSEGGDNEYNNLYTLLHIQKAKHVFTEYTTTLRETDHWGGAIFTVYPIVGMGKIKFDVKSNNLCMFVDLKINKDTIRVYNVHLQSISFNKTDYKFVDDLMNNKETEELDKSKNILNRLKRAYIKRAQQAEMVAKHIADSPYPVILCGDFNDTPSSYAYHTISSTLNDAFVESGRGLGRTYIGKFPSFRIDFILHSDALKALQYYTIEEKLSDHYPICSYFEKR
jgi:endonuclease/exonuclease/phosphatase family metal-dependent hydrolase